MRNNKSFIKIHSPDDDGGGDAWTAARALSVLDLVKGRTGPALEDAVPDARVRGVAWRQPPAIRQLLRPPSTLADDAIARVRPERMASPGLKNGQGRAGT